ncbi:M-phase inducer phosphatase [Smittium culicis]|uniref:protein-tyrosine-phosphatase n=1 Tax=Smittium culicis TaxID=133412 RepID=A0A1R1XAE0_9FUNG|nr:M-phase inducer phosphatase [Smittium culicis]
MFFKSNLTSQNVIIVFHCEFSIKRAPSMASHFRKIDREFNNYPSLTYPNIFLLQGGYSNFFLHNSQYCSPQNYVQMDDLNFKLDCSKHTKLFDHQFKRSKSSAIRPFSFNNINSPTNTCSVIRKTKSIKPGIY